MKVTFFFQIMELLISKLIIQHNNNEVVSKMLRVHYVLNWTFNSK